MPYIKSADRVDLNNDCDPVTAGELNYVITMTCLTYLDANGTSYQVLNEIIGVLECAKLEFYRRACAPYEDTKITQNGDLYPATEKLSDLL